MPSIKQLYMLVFFVPVEYSEQVKEGIFKAGGGRIGAYDCCCWQTLGQGQFRPLKGSDPFIGKTGQVEKLDELRIEMVCAGEFLAAVLKALRDNHPYETPAYACWPVEG